MCFTVVCPSGMAISRLNTPIIVALPTESFFLFGMPLCCLVIFFFHATTLFFKWPMELHHWLAFVGFFGLELLLMSFGIVLNAPFSSVSGMNNENCSWMRPWKLLKKAHAFEMSWWQLHSTSSKEHANDAATQLKTTQMCSWRLQFWGLWWFPRWFRDASYQIRHSHCFWLLFSSWGLVFSCQLGNSDNKFSSSSSDWTPVHKNGTGGWKQTAAFAWK